MGLTLGFVGVDIMDERETEGEEEKEEKRKEDWLFVTKKAIDEVVDDDGKNGGGEKLISTIGLPGKFFLFSEEGFENFDGFKEEVWRHLVLSIQKKGKECKCKEEMGILRY